MWLSKIRQYLDAVVGGVCLITITVAFASAPTTPPSDFTLHGNGTVTHNKTGLMWQQCLVGQTWSGSGCGGTAATHTWDNAIALTSSFAAYSDWRLPSIDELASIVENTVAAPSINTSIFPSTPITKQWSSTHSPWANFAKWSVDFNTGMSRGDQDKNNAYSIRMVRGARTSVNGASTANFSDNGDGTVVHIKTALTWKRCPEGMSWSGQDCSGSIKKYVWADAFTLTSNHAGHTDWRLPTNSELSSLVDHHAMPAISTSIFPSSNSPFWTSTSRFDDAWYIDFSSGSNTTINKTMPANVLMVRGSYGGAVADCLFNWAERNYSSYLSPAGGISVPLGEYYYRYYNGTNAYLATNSKDNYLYYMGPASGNRPTNIGSVPRWLLQAQCE